VSSADIALTLFALCNSVRVFAYVPQIIAVARDPCGASAISYATWGLFAVSNLSTVFYAVLVVDDWRMGAVFVANTLCCVVILGLTAWKRALFKTAQQLLAASDSAILQNGNGNDKIIERTPLGKYRLVSGGKDVAV
jgi:hypothetical protein